MTNPQAPQSVTINRALVGTIALVMIVSAGGLCLFLGSQNIWTGACLKVGLVMSAFWLALPTIFRQGNWGQVSLGGLIGFMALALVLTRTRVDPRIVILMLLGVVLTVMFLKPKSRVRPK